MTADVWLRRTVRIAAVIVIGTCLAVSAGRFGWFASRSLQFQYPLDYGEGAVLDVSVRLADGTNIYPAQLTSPNWFVSNYPPLYYVARAAAIRLHGPALWPGRLISQLSTVATAALIFLVLRRLTSHTVAAAVGGLSFLTIPFTAVWAQYDRVDMLALALNWAGLWCVVTQRRGGVAAVALFVASSFTRQTGAVAGAAAAYLWLYREKGPSAANRLALFVAGGGAVVTLILNLVTQGGFVFHAVRGTVSEMSVSQLFNLGRQPLELMPVFVSCAVLATVLGWRYGKPGWTVVAAYTAGAVVLALTVAKTGSYINYFLDLCAACSLAVGASVAWLAPRPKLCCAFLIAVWLQIAYFADDNSLYERLDARLHRSTDYGRLIEVVRGVEGPLLADEPLALLPLTGRRAEFHPFGMTQLADVGLWDESSFIDTVRLGRYKMILLRMSSSQPVVLRNMWTERMADAILSGYERVQSFPVDDRAEVVVFVPRRNP